MFQSFLQGFGKPFFLLLQGIRHKFPGPGQFRAGFSHDAIQGLYQFMEERFMETQFGPMPQRPADDTA